MRSLGKKFPTIKDGLNMKGQLEDHSASEGTGS
jgi:hypothetical protein